VTEQINVLMIAHTFPPSSEVGGHRMAGFCRYLPDHGVRPVVVTVQEGVAGPGDRTIPIPKGILIKRTTTLATPLDWYKRRKAKAPSSKGAPPAPTTRRERRGFIRRQSLAILQTPDEFWGWYFPALRASKELIKNKPIAAVLSTGPPWTAHLVARHLRKTLGIPWIADFRDPWAENEGLNDCPSWLRRIHVMLEASAIRRADAVICNTEPLRLLFQERYPHLPATKFVTVTNGFDNAGGKVEIESRTSPERLIVHMGSLYGERRIDTFCEAVAFLQTNEKTQASSVRIQFVGESEEKIMAAARRRTPELISNNQIEFLPKVSWQKGQEIMWGADLLVLFPGNRFQVPAKFYEYLRTGKPIFAVANPGALTDLIDSTGAGVWADINDPKDIAGKLLTALQLPIRSQEEVQARWDGQFHYRALAAQLAEQILRVARPPKSWH